MTSSTSSSGRRAAPRPLVLALALAAAPAALSCGHAGPHPGDRARTFSIAVLPVDNLSGGGAPVRDLLPQVERALARAGLRIVGGEAVQAFLARHRVRYTGAVDGATARAAGEELGVDGILVTSLDQYAAENVPQFGISMRVVSAEEQARILWVDAFHRVGNDAPGLLALGVVKDVEVLREEALDRLAASLAAALAGEFRPVQACEGERRFQPRVRFRGGDLPPERPYSVAVVPFANRTSRRGAGEAVSLEFVRQLASSGRFRVLEPGVVRDVLIRFRIVMTGGVSVDTARMMVGALGADLVLGGEVLEFGDVSGAGPGVAFGAVMLESGSGEVVWASSSYARGEDGVHFFGIGRVRSAPALACRMVNGVIDRMIGSSSRPGPVTAPAPEAPASQPDAPPPLVPRRGDGA